MSGWRLGIHAGFFRREVEIAERSSLALASRSSTDELRPDQYSIAFPRRYFVPHRSSITTHTPYISLPRCSTRFRAHSCFQFVARHRGISSLVIHSVSAARPVDL